MADGYLRHPAYGTISTGRDALYAYHMRQHQADAMYGHPHAGFAYVPAPYGRSPQFDPRAIQERAYSDAYGRYVAAPRFSVDPRMEEMMNARQEAMMKLAAPSSPVSANGLHILVTGGAGYIGSHTVLELVNAGYGVTVLDNLVNSSEESLRRVGEITGKPEAIRFFNCDLVDEKQVEDLFAQSPRFHCVIHFAALKAVGESTKIPVQYYKNNITGTLILLEAMDKYECRSIVFSSSATVYGAADIPYTEGSQVGVGITSPYGRTKYMIEEILRDQAKLKDVQWKVILLRYFNPVGAHPCGRIGEDPSGIPNNLMPYISQVCVGKRDHLTVFGDDYDTPDGTCLRDYIHVVDLAKGHVAALKKVNDDGGFAEVFNLGSGKGTSVLELVKAMEKAVGKPIQCEMGPRRDGDLPAFWANPDKAWKELGWKTEKSVDDLCADTWRWQKNNPSGYN